MPTAIRSGIFELDEGFTMITAVGPSAIMFEIGVLHGTTAPVVVHARRAREKFLR